MHQDVFRLTDSDSSEEDSSWPFGLSSINSREKIESSAEDGEVLRTTLGRDTEPLGEFQLTRIWDARQIIKIVAKFWWINLYDKSNM